MQALGDNSLSSFLKRLLDAGYAACSALFAAMAVLLVVVLFFSARLSPGAFDVEVKVSAKSDTMTLTDSTGTKLAVSAGEVTLQPPSKYWRHAAVVELATLMGEFLVALYIIQKLRELTKTFVAR